MCCGSTKAIRIVLDVFNSFSVFGGLACIGCSAYIYSVTSDIYAVLNDPLLSYSLTLLVGVGLSLCVFGLVGICATWHLEHKALLTNAIIMIIVIIVHLTTGTLAVLYNEMGLSRLSESLTEQTLSQYYGLAGNDSISKAWNALHVKFQCCGNNDYMDWRMNPIYFGDQKIPLTCCKGWTSPWRYNSSFVPDTVDIEACLGEASIPYLPVASFFNIKGCFEELTSWMSKFFVLLLIAGFTLVPFEIVVVWASINLYCKTEGWKGVKTKSKANDYRIYENHPDYET